eukprot:GHRR01004551.1.p1 GENE.GHRR01004551.1~~GHRR01004551.1.p1  ORF type:complete len:331 (+),score=100.15 GHRR01004551.1:122-994(+)
MGDKDTYRDDHRDDYRRGGYRDHRNSGGGYRQDYNGYRGGSGRGRGYRSGSGGGGYDRRQQQQGSRHFQSSYVGQKRGRDEPEALDPKRQVIKRLMKIGEPGQFSETDKTTAGDTPEKTVENALWALKQEIKHKTENLNEIVLEAVISCSHKAAHYAVLLGLLHSENPDWVAALLSDAGKRFESELAAGDVRGPRLLLRLFSCLTGTSVLHSADVLGLMERVLEVAQAQATAGVDPSGLTWQLWSDQLVYAVLGGLVWGGAHLAGPVAADQHSRVLDRAAEYMAARPIQV